MAENGKAAGSKTADSRNKNSKKLSAAGKKQELEYQSSNRKIAQVPSPLWGEGTRRQRKQGIRRTQWN